MNRRKALREQMKTGKTVVGSFVLGHDPGVVRVAATADLDFLLLDYEHGTPSDELTARFIDVAQASTTALFIRCSLHDLPVIPRLFDHGLDGVLVAGAETLADVQAVVDAAKFPPHGHRGLNPFVPAAGYGAQTADTFMQLQNERTHVWILAESQRLLAQLNAVSQLPGVDGIFLGPYDLSVDLGVAGEIHHPMVLAEIDHAIHTLQQNGLPVGIYAKDTNATLQWMEKGVSFLVVGFDWSLLRTAWSEIVKCCGNQADMG